MALSDLDRELLDHQRLLENEILLALRDEGQPMGTRKLFAVIRKGSTLSDFQSIARRALWSLAARDEVSRTPEGWVLFDG